jgi:hypothetical protein
VPDLPKLYLKDLLQAVCYCAAPPMGLSQERKCRAERCSDFLKIVSSAKIPYGQEPTSRVYAAGVYGTAPFEAETPGGD